MAKIQFLFYQITDLTGLANVNDVADHMTDAVRTIISIMPEKYKTKCSAYTLMNADANTTLDLDDKGDILKVTREDADTGYYRNCREVKSEIADLLNDSSSLYYATAGSPAYWTEANSSGNATLFVKPNPTNTQPAKAYYVSYPSFVASGSGDWDIFNTLKTIPNFPDEAEKLVLLQTAMNILQQKLQEKSEDLPSDLAIPVMGVITTSLPSYTAPSAYTMPVAPASVDVSFSEVGSIETFTSPVFSAPTLGTISAMDLPVVPVAPTMSEKSVTITGDAPTYTQPVVSLSEAPTVGTLTITAVLPVAPSVDLSSMSITGTVPTYTAPVLSLDALTITNLSISSSAPVAPSIDLSSVSISGDAPTYTQPVLSLSSAPTVGTLSISTSVPVTPTLTDNSISFSTDAPSYIAPVSPVLGDSSISFSTAVPTYTAPVLSLDSLTVTDLTLSSVAPVAPSIDLNTISITGDAPTYIQPVLSLNTLTVTDLTISCTTPVAPSVDLNTITAFGTAPVYTAPVFSIEAKPTIADLSISSVAPVAPSLTDNTVVTAGLSNPTFVAPVMTAPNWADVDNWITTE